jgi:hypothetical protein
MSKLPGKIGSASGKSAIEVRILLKHVFSRSTEFVLDLSKLLLDTQDRQLLGKYRGA